MVTLHPTLVPPRPASEAFPKPSTNLHLEIMPLALMSFHHIRNATKIQNLKLLTKKMGMDGVFRRGHPGVLLVSHPKSVDVLDRFTREVKTWRWATANVCGIDGSLDIRWKHTGLEERDKIRDVVHEATENGGEEVAQWVMKGLRLGKTT